MNRQWLRFVALHFFFGACKRYNLFCRFYRKSHNIWCFCDVKTLAIIIFAVRICSRRILSVNRLARKISLMCVCFAYAKWASCVRKMVLSSGIVFVVQNRLWTIVVVSCLLWSISLSIYGHLHFRIKWVIMFLEHVLLNVYTTNR